MNIEMVLKEMIRSLSPQQITVDSIFETADLIKDLGFNSINLIQLVINIENEFNIEFDDAMLGFESLIIFNNLVKYVKEKIAEVPVNE